MHSDAFMYVGKRVICADLRQGMLSILAVYLEKPPWANVFALRKSFAFAHRFWRPCRLQSAMLGSVQGLYEPLCSHELVFYRFWRASM